MTLTKLLYRCSPASWLQLVLAPVGARGQDAAYTLNPVAGQGLTSVVRDGNPLFALVAGPMLAATLALKRLWINAGYFAAGGVECQEHSFVAERKSE